MKRFQALGRLKTGQQNKTEAAYGEVLRLRQIAGDVAWYRFEGIKLRLADNTFYTPDYAVMLSNGEMELHEVKGFWIDDARVKIKIASEMYPFRFAAVMARKKKEGGGWAYEWFGSAPDLSPENATSASEKPSNSGDSHGIEDGQASASNTLPALNDYEEQSRNV